MTTTTIVFTVRRLNIKELINTFHSNIVQGLTLATDLSMLMYNHNTKMLAVKLSI